MPFGFYVSDAGAGKPHTQAAVPLNMCPTSGCGIEALVIPVVGRGHRSEQPLELQFSPDSPAGIKTLAGLVVSTLQSGPPFAFHTSSIQVL